MSPCKKIVCSLAALLLLVSPVMAQSGTIVLKVEEIFTPDGTLSGVDASKGPPPRALRISVANGSDKDSVYVEVRYALFVQDLKDTRLQFLTVGVIGTKVFSIEKGKKEEILTKSVVSVRQDQVREKNGQGRVIRVTPAVRTEYAGYLVQVRQDGKVIRETISPKLAGKIDIPGLDGKFNTAQ